MRGIASITLALAAAVAISSGPAPAAAQGPAECPIPKKPYEGGNPRFHRGSIDIGGIPYRFTILLPAGYSTSTRRYPVLYVFHGGGGNEEVMIGPGDSPKLIETISADEPVIIVMPDGGVIGGHTDWPDDPAQQWETFHIKRLVPHIDATYRTLADADHRAVFGFSVGGFGAMSYAARNPGVFGAAGSASGFPDTSRPDIQAAILPFIVVLRATCTASQAPLGPWGDPVTGRATWEEHNPTALVDRLRGTLLYATSGNGVPCDLEDVETVASKVIPDYTNAIESQLRESNRSFHAALVAAGIEHVYREPACGVHTHRYFDTALREWWPTMMGFFDTAEQPAAVTAMRLRVQPRRVGAGRRTLLRIQASDGARRPLSGVRLRLGSSRARTGRDGRATLKVVLRRPGYRRLVATKPGFRRATARIRAVTR